MQYRFGALALFVAWLFMLSTVSPAATIPNREKKRILDSNHSAEGSSVVQPVNAVNLPLDENGFVRVSEQGNNPNPKPVIVTNFPPVQAVEGSVSVTNFPPVQDVNVLNPAPGGAPYHLVGFTQATLPADSGAFGFTRACQAEFSGSRLCTLQEALTTTTLPDLSGAGTNTAWISEPDVDGNGFSSDCDGWRYAGTAYQFGGLTLDRDGRYGQRECYSVFSVACCAPRGN